MIVQASAKKVAYRYLAAKQEREASKLRDILRAWIQQPLKIMFDTIKRLPKNAFDDVLDVAIGEALPKIAIEIQKAKVQKDFDEFKRGVVAGATAKKQGEFIGRNKSSYPNWEKCLRRGEKCDWEREGFLFGFLHYDSLGPQMNMSSKDRDFLLNAMITYQKKSLSQNVIKGLIWDIITDLSPRTMWKKMKESMKSHGKKVGLALGIVLFLENVVIPLYVMPLLGLPPIPLPLEAIVIPVVLNKLGVIAIDDVHHTPIVDQHLSGKDQKLMLRNKRQLRKAYLII